MPEPTPEAVRAARVAVERLGRERSQILDDASRTGVLDRTQLGQLDQRLGAVLDDLHQRVDPADASPTVPLVLLPVRLETRFRDSAGAATLHIRIFPDEIHVDSLQRALTREEIEAGQAYWISVWNEPESADAWRSFVAAVGQSRAEWVAAACTPENLVERGVARPAFPRPPTTSNRDAMVRALPDRFVAVAVQGARTSRAVGRPIPPDLQVNPLPVGEERPLDDGLPTPPGAEWLSDFAAARRIGMALALELPSADPVDRLVVVGVQAAIAPAAAADELEDLLVSHRFTDGFGLLSQGTPTNNADGERSPYRPRRAPEPPAMARPPIPDDSDTAALAGLLGLDAGRVGQLAGPGTGEQTLSRHVNAALWSPGWGDYLKRLAERGVDGPDDAHREATRLLFRDHVRGSGPAPAIRVGAQPYGVLPVSDLDRWQPRDSEMPSGTAGLLRRLLTRWGLAAHRYVPRIRPGADDVEAAVVDVMGTAPQMLGLRVRPVVSDDVTDSVVAALGTGGPEREAERRISQAILASALGQSHATRAAGARFGSLHKDTRPLPLPLVSPRDDEFIQALLADRPAPVDSVLQALLALAIEALNEEVVASSPASALPQAIELAGLDDALRTRLQHAVARADDVPAPEFLALAEAIPGPTGGPVMLHLSQPLPGLQTSLAEVALSAPISADARRAAASAVSGWAQAMAARNEVLDGMRALIGTDEAQRGRAVAAALDCSSHRLDAWITALFDQRARARDGARGLTIGAYGVVEDLRPDPQPMGDGWIHAPSPAHAATAGILRSAHLSHRRTDGDPFAIDLSSARVRSATHVIDGVRQGQQLAALIGYQIERGLAERGLARLQQNLRALAPLVARRLSDRDGSDAAGVKEAVAAANVVDGLLLLHKYPVDESPAFAALVAALNLPPANLYLEPGTWPRLDRGEESALAEVLRAAADTVDAVADVMLSESVLQYASGNPTRAGAALDAVSSGASPADTIDVLEAHDSADRLTHRILAIAGDDGVAWNSTRPRAIAEPALEAWAAAHLGRPADIVLADVNGTLVTLAATRFAALDLVHSDEGAFESAVRAMMPALGAHPMARRTGPAWPPGSRPIRDVLALAATLRRVLSGARPIAPGDLCRPSTPATYRLLRHDLEQRLQRAAGLLANAVNAVGSLVEGVPPNGEVVDGPAAARLSAGALELDAFGIPLHPEAERPRDMSWVRDAWMIADSRSRAAQSALGVLLSLPAGASEPQLLDAAEALASAVFGDGFAVAPVLEPPPGDSDFRMALASPAFPAPSPHLVRQFVRDYGTVRPAVARWAEVVLLGDAIGPSPDIGVVQLTQTLDGAAAPGTTTWLAGPRPPGEPWPKAPAAHLMLDSTGRLDGPVAGVVVDAWVESLPEQGVDAFKPQRARTGLAVRANAASARAPQSVLVAVTPDGARWTADSIVRVVEQTLDLARARMVTFERLAGEGLVLPALYVRSSSLQGEKALALDKLVDARSRYLAAPYVKEARP